MSLSQKNAHHGMIAPEKSFRNAEAAANRALRLDPTLDEAYTALALLYLYQFWDWPGCLEGSVQCPGILFVFVRKFII